MLAGLPNLIILNFNTDFDRNSYLTPQCCIPCEHEPDSLEIGAGTTPPSQVPRGTDSLQWVLTPEQQSAAAVPCGSSPRSCGGHEGW